MAITGLTTAQVVSPEWGNYNILQINMNTSVSDLEVWQYIRNNRPSCPYFIQCQPTRMMNLGLNYAGGVLEDNSYLKFTTTATERGVGGIDLGYWTPYSPYITYPYISFIWGSTGGYSSGWFYGYNPNPEITSSSGPNGFPYLALKCIDTGNGTPTYGLYKICFKETAYGTGDNLDLSNYRSGHLSDAISTLGVQNIAGMVNDGLILPNSYKSVDPYGAEGGTSATGGGTGDFDGTSDNVDIPALPTLSATSAGFITLFNPTATQLRDLASYMWTNPLFNMDNWKKIFADPMDAIIGLSIVPVSVPNGAVREVQVGNIGTGVHMTTAAAQYVTVDCGTLNVNEYWGAYLDYSPYTKAELYLPYIGTRPIDTDDIMGKSVHVVYHVDILSGACCAYVKCGNSVLYNFIGQCSSSIPITGRDWTDVINGIIGIAGSVGSMVATEGASAPSAIGNIAATASNVMKPNIEKSGAMAGTGGMMSIQTPYLILTRPRQAVPANQNEFTGYPAFITMRLSDLSGYTEIESIHLENVPATEQEYSEIVSLLKGGAIF